MRTALTLFWHFRVPKIPLLNFRKNWQTFGELQGNSAFSRKSVKLREIFMTICENRDENRILKSKILRISSEMFANFATTKKFDEILLKFCEWSGAKEY